MKSKILVVRTRKEECVADVQKIMQCPVTPQEMLEAVSNDQKLTYQAQCQRSAQNAFQDYISDIQRED